MKLNSIIGLLTVFSVLGCTAQKDVKKIPESISGIYPRLAYYNNEGEWDRGSRTLGGSFMGGYLWASFTEWLF